MLLEETAAEARERVRLAFPKKRKVRGVKRELKPVPFREAGPKRPPKGFDQEDDLLAVNVSGETYSAAVGYVDDSAWSSMVDDYLGKELPGPRGPQDIVDVLGADRYEWEVEQDMMHDFVERVRSGQESAAKENGIVDFMWVAVVDQKTDDCCLKRDGLGSSEIEEKLKGPWKEDECKATVAPAHFNCRCVMVPMSSDLLDVPTADYGDFDQWLNAA
jgi:hypothetical protein